MGNKPTRSKLFKVAQDTKWLDLTDSKLKSIPIEVFYIQPRGLSLSFNSIMLPEDIGTTLSSLEFLDCSGCNLLKVPRSVSYLSNLKEMVLSHNSLSLLPMLPPSLEKLDVSYNMFVQVPEHLLELPNLFYVNLVGNPCYNNHKDGLPLKGKAKVESLIVGNIELHIDNLISRLNMNELEVLIQLFHDISTDEPNPTTGPLLDRDGMLKRMGLSFLPDTVIVDSFFRAFANYSTVNDNLTNSSLPKNFMDLRGFLVGLIIIFKGTVEEKLKFTFDIFDLDGDGAIDLEDMLAIAKSGLLASIILANYYNASEDEMDGRSSRSFFESEDHSEKRRANEPIKIETKEMDLALQYNGKVINEMRVEHNSVQHILKHKAYKAQWPIVKETVTKQFKEMVTVTKDASTTSSNKINFKEYHRYWLSNFSGVNEFLNFYGSMFRYGP